MRRTAVALAALAVLCGCGAAATPAGAPEPATARGLAAALDQHLGGFQTSGWAGSRRVSKERPTPGTFLDASVDVDRTGGKGSIFVTLNDNDLLADTRCGGDSGFRVLECRHLSDGSLLELSRGTIAAGTDCVIGRLTSQHRGNLLVEAQSTDPDFFAAALVEELLLDQHLGMRTTHSLNEAGLDIRPFTKTSYSITVTEDDGR